MNKRLVFSIITSTICLALLVGAFFIVPKPTQAAANTPISVTQPTDCTPMHTLDEQTCVVSVSIKYNVSSGVHFSVASSTVWCYDKCRTYSTWKGVATALPEGNSVVYSYAPIYVLLNAPYMGVHGSETVTYTFTGPSNKVSVQIVLPNYMGA